MTILLFSYDYSNAEIIKLRPGECIFSYEYLLALMGIQEGCLLLFCWQQSLELWYSRLPWILEFPETLGLASPFIHVCVGGGEEHTRRIQKKTSTVILPVVSILLQSSSFVFVVLFLIFFSMGSLQTQNLASRIDWLASDIQGSNHLFLSSSGIPSECYHAQLLKC